MDWIFWSRCDWAAWGWEHPWTLAICPTVLLTAWALDKIRKGR